MLTDFCGTLIDLGQVICVSPVRTDATGDTFFVIQFWGGGSTSIHRKSKRCVKNMRSKFVDRLKELGCMEGK